MQMSQAASKTTYCRICEAACGLRVEFDGSGNPLRILPDREHPISRGYVCAKGTRFLEVANHPDRLLHPMRRNADGSLQRISWQAAFGVFSEKVKPILDTYGPHAIGIYFGNPLAFNATGIVAMVGLMKALGSRNIFTAGSQDCNNKFAASQMMHGSPLIHPIPDFENADFALLLGTNPAVSQSSFIHLEGGAAVFDDMLQRGAQFTFVDPRRTESAQRWGQHLPIRPGTDVYLLLTLINEFQEAYRPDEHVDGLQSLLELAATFPIERASQLTGIPADHIHTLTDDIRTAQRAAFHMSVGVNQGPFGTLSYIAMQALAYLTSNFDSEGGLLFHPTAVLAARAAERYRVGTSQVRSRIGNFPAILDTLPGGILADEILTPGSGQIRAIIVVAGDPLRSIPGEEKLRRAFEQLEFVVSVDLFENNTGRMADLLLPTNSWLERWDFATTTAFFQKSRFVQYAAPIVPTPGKVRPEAHILDEMGKMLGLRLFGRGPLRWLWSLLPGDATLAKLVDLLTLPFRPFFNGARGIPSLTPKPGKYLGRGPRTTGHRVRFWHPDLDAERVRLEVSATTLEQIHVSSGEPLFALMSRRRRLGHNTWLHGATRDGDPIAAAWMAPADLQQSGIPDGGQIVLISQAGELRLPALSKDGVARGTVIVPHGLPDLNINALIPNDTEFIEPLSGQHIMTGIAVRIRVENAAQD